MRAPPLSEAVLCCVAHVAARLVEFLVAGLVVVDHLQKNLFNEEVAAMAALVVVAVLLRLACRRSQTGACASGILDVKTCKRQRNDPTIPQPFLSRETCCWKK